MTQQEAAAALEAFKSNLTLSGKWTEESEVYYDLYEERLSKEVCDTIIAVLQSAAHPETPADAQGREWMPIETAPRDGTFIFVAHQNENGKWSRYIAFYAPERTLPLGEDNFIDCDGDDEFAPAGFYTDTSDEERVTSCDPTHWMPLPAAPQTAMEGE